MAIRTVPTDEGTETVSVRLPKSFVRRLKDMAGALDVNLNTFVAASFVWGHLPDGWNMDDCLSDFRRVLGKGPIERVVLGTWATAESAELEASCKRLAQLGLIENFARKDAGEHTIASFSLTVPGMFVAKYYLRANVVDAR